MTAISPIQDTQSATLQELREWFDSYCAALPDNDKNLIGTAWSLAQEHYPADAATPYGEPLPDHFLGAAQMVDELDLLPDAVAATLLADIGRYVPIGTYWFPSAATAPSPSWSKVWTKCRSSPTSPGWTASPLPKSARSKPKPCGKCCWRWLPTSASY